MEFIDSILVLTLQEKNPSRLISHHSVARVFRERLAQVIQCFVVFPLSLERQGIKVMGLSQCWIEIESLFQNLLGARRVTFLNANSPNVDPAIGITGIDFCYLDKNRFRGFKIALQQESDAIVVPTQKVGLLE